MKHIQSHTGIKIKQKLVIHDTKKLAIIVTLQYYIMTALPGLLDKDDQVRYIMYMLTKDDCSKPDLMFTTITQHHIYRTTNDISPVNSQPFLYTIWDQVWR